MRTTFVVAADGPRHGADTPADLPRVMSSKARSISHGAQTNAAAVSDIAALRRLYNEALRAERDWEPANVAKDEAIAAAHDDHPDAWPRLPNHYSTGSFRPDCEMVDEYRAYGAERDRVERALVDGAVLDRAEDLSRKMYEARDCFVRTKAKTVAGLVFKLRRLLRRVNDWVEFEDIIEQAIAELDEAPKTLVLDSAGALASAAGKVVAEAQETV